MALAMGRQHSGTGGTGPGHLGKKRPRGAGSCHHHHSAPSRDDNPTTRWQNNNSQEVVLSVIQGEGEEAAVCEHSTLSWAVDFYFLCRSIDRKSNDSSPGQCTPNSHRITRDTKAAHAHAVMACMAWQACNTTLLDACLFLTTTHSSQFIHYSTNTCIQGIRRDDTGKPTCARAALRQLYYNYANWAWHPWVLDPILDTALSQDLRVLTDINTTTDQHGPSITDMAAIAKGMRFYDGTTGVCTHTHTCHSEL